MQKKLLDYLEIEKENHLMQLIDLLKIPTISSDSKFNSAMKKCATWLQKHIKDIGFNNVTIIEDRDKIANIKYPYTSSKKKGHPIIYGEWLEAGPKAKTILIYGHYDVQPVDPINLWETLPFEPTIRNGKIYARGSSDDKGQFFCHLKALEAHMKLFGKLPVNVKLLLEGEEESDSSLDEFIINNKELLKCDYAVISDTEWFAPNIPSICYALRGIAYVEVKVTGPNRDLHSGTFGGAVDNPIQVLASMISQLKDERGRITIPNFYDDVLELTEEERNEFKKLPFDEENYKKDLGVAELSGEEGYSTLERTWARPSLDVHGITGGYTGEGAKTVLPSWASAKMSTRIVSLQKPSEISKKLADYLRAIAPPTVKVEVDELHYGAPVLVNIHSEGITAAIKAFKKAFNTQKVVFMREGGSIPIVSVFENELNAPSILMGFGLPDDNIHSPNESFALENFFGGIRTAALFYDMLK